MTRRTIALALVALLASPLAGCSSFSKQGRQQKAYEKYVRKSSVGRQKQRAKFRQEKSQNLPPPMEPSEPVETTETGPAAMPSDGG